MFLRKLNGPRSITLPCGSIMTRGDLPSPRTTRWVASRKKALVLAVIHGLMDRKDAIDIYELSEEELSEWERAVKAHGQDGLRATALQKYRQP